MRLVFLLISQLIPNIERRVGYLQDRHGRYATRLPLSIGCLYSLSLNVHSFQGNKGKNSRIFSQKAQNGENN